MSALPIFNRLDESPGFGPDHLGDGDATRGQVVYPINFTLDQGFAPANTVSDAQNIGIRAALELVDETLERVKGPNLITGNAVAVHGFLQNSVAIAVFDLPFHMLSPHSIATEERCPAICTIRKALTSRTATTP